MLLLVSDQTVGLAEIDQIWCYANDDLRSDPELLYDPARKGCSIISYQQGSTRRDGVAVCALAYKLRNERSRTVGVTLLTP